VAVQETTLDGVLQEFPTTTPPVEVERTSAGAYTFETAVLPGSGPIGVQVSPLLENGPPGQAAAACGVRSVGNGLSTVPGRGPVTRIAVQCRGPARFGPVDVPVALSVVRGVSPLGSSRLNTAIVTPTAGSRTASPTSSPRCSPC
jgi:hypothetical protein